MNDLHPDPEKEDPVTTASDHGDGRREGESEIPWKIPVAAAIAGALAVAVFVIYAIVVGPTVDDSEDTGVGSSVLGAPQPSDAFPDGYVEVADQIGARVESIEESSARAVVAVSTAVPGSSDPAEVAPLDVAFWEIVTATGSTAMENQYRWPDLAGSDGGYISIAFPPGSTTSDGELVAYAVGSVETQTTTFELPQASQATVTDLRFDLGDGHSLVVESMTITTDGGSVAWRIEGGLTARVDAIVTLVVSDATTGLPITLMPEYAKAYAEDPLVGSAPVPLPYQFRSEYRLVSDRASDANIVVTAASVEFRITSVTSVEDPVTLSMGLIP